MSLNILMIATIAQSLTVVPYDVRNAQGDVVPKKNVATFSSGKDTLQHSSLNALSISPDVKRGATDKAPSTEDFAAGYTPKSYSNGYPAETYGKSILAMESDRADASEKKLPSAVSGSNVPNIIKPAQARAQRKASQRAASNLQTLFYILSAADAAQTAYAVNAGRAKEFNPLYGSNPSTRRIITTKLAFGAVSFFAFRHYNRISPKGAYNIALLSVIAQGAIVALNMRAFSDK